jgi:peptidoglycan hydrolase CwlO-like protein
MNLNLEIKRREAELLRVQAAKADQAFKIEESLDQIKRLQDMGKAQDERMAQLTKEIEDLKQKL